MTRSAGTRPDGGARVSCTGVVHIYTDAGGDDVVALRGVDLEVAAGERLCLLGPSGAGKSTLLQLLGATMRASAGTVLLDDVDLRAVSADGMSRLRAGRVGTVLQGAPRNLLPYADARQNVAAVQRALPRAERRRLRSPDDLLDALGLAGVSRLPLRGLSGGQLQRVAVVAAVANGPGLLLADEPTSQLDTEQRDSVLDLIDTVAEQFGTTVIVVTHDPEVAARWPRAVAIQDGRVGTEGLGGAQRAVVGADGSVPLPERLRRLWPPGTLVEISEDDDAIVLRRDQR